MTAGQSTTSLQHLHTCHNPSDFTSPVSSTNTITIQCSILSAYFPSIFTSPSFLLPESHPLVSFRAPSSILYLNLIVARNVNICLCFKMNPSETLQQTFTVSARGYWLQIKKPSPMQSLFIDVCSVVTSEGYWCSWLVFHCERIPLTQG